MLPCGPARGPPRPGLLGETLNLQRLLPHGSRIASLLPRALAEVAADRAGDCAWFAWPRGRRVLAANLEHAAGPQATHATRGAFRTYARYYLSMQRLAHLPLSRAVGALRWRSREHLEDSLAAGRGALVLTAHFGNWDLVGAGLAQCGWQPCVFTERLAPRPLFEFYRRARHRMGMTVSPAGDPGRAPWRTLARNGVLALVADRPFGNRLETVRLGEADLQVPTGGIRLALRAGAAIHGVFAVRTPEGFELHCGPDWAAPARRHADERAQMRSVAGAFARQLQTMVRAYPEQWCLLAELPRHANPLPGAGSAA